VIRINVDKDVDGWMPLPGQTDKHGNLIEDREFGITDWARSVILEQRHELVAQQVAAYLALTDPYAKTIVFCVDVVTTLSPFYPQSPVRFSALPITAWEFHSQNSRTPIREQTTAVHRLL